MATQPSRRRGRHLARCRDHAPGLLAAILDRFAIGLDRWSGGDPSTLARTVECSRPAARYAGRPSTSASRIVAGLRLRHRRGWSPVRSTREREADTASSGGPGPPLRRCVDFDPADLAAVAIAAPMSAELGELPCRPWWARGLACRPSRSGSAWRCRSCCMCRSGSRRPGRRRNRAALRRRRGRGSRRRARR